MIQNAGKLVWLSSSGGYFALCSRLIPCFVRFWRLLCMYLVTFSLPFVQMFVCFWRLLCMYLVTFSFPSCSDVFSAVGGYCYLVTFPCSGKTFFEGVSLTMTVVRPMQAFVAETSSQWCAGNSCLTAGYKAWPSYTWTSEKDKAENMPLTSSSTIAWLTWAFTCISYISITLFISTISYLYTYLNTYWASAFSPLPSNTGLSMHSGHGWAAQGRQADCYPCLHASSSLSPSRLLRSSLAKKGSLSHLRWGGGGKFRQDKIIIVDSMIEGSWGYNDINFFLWCGRHFS